MGNFQFKIDTPPQRGQTCMIVDSQFTSEKKYPNVAFKQGSKVTVIDSRNLICSRPNAPKITVSLVQFGDKSRDVYLTNNLRPV